MAQRRIRQCKGCGRIVIFEDDKKTVSHEAPQCDWFEDLMRRAQELFPGRVEATITVRDASGRELPMAKA